jgi:hypothetical protein
MPNLFPRKVKKKVIGYGERAIVKETGVKGIVARFYRKRLLDWRREEGAADSPKFAFYKNKIARLIAPENFLHVTAAFQRAKPSMWVTLSKKKVFDVTSQGIVDAVNNNRLMHPRNTKRRLAFEKSVAFKEHTARVEKEARPLAFALWDKGIEVNINPYNVFFDKKGNPVFLDVVSIEPYLVGQAFPGNKKIEKYLERATGEWGRIVPKEEW